MYQCDSCGLSPNHLKLQKITHCTIGNPLPLSERFNLITVPLISLIHILIFSLAQTMLHKMIKFRVLLKMWRISPTHISVAVQCNEDETFLKSYAYPLPLFSLFKICQLVLSVQENLSLQLSLLFSIQKPSQHVIYFHNYVNKMLLNTFFCSPT